MTFQYKTTPIHYETFGKGPVIVLLHGFLESASMWKPIIPELAKNNTLLILDFPGHGKSGIIDQTHSMELMAELVDKILQKLQITKASFVGHSMGGYVALAYAELYSEKIEKLILLNATAVEDSPERKLNRNRALTVIEKNKNVFISMAIGNLFTEASREKFPEEIDTLKTEAYTFPLEGIKAAIKGMRDRKDRTVILKNLNKEKYLILAKEDPILDYLETKRMAECCGTSVKTIEGGHMSVLEKPKTITTLFQEIFKASN